MKIPFPTFTYTGGQPFWILIVSICLFMASCNESKEELVAPDAKEQQADNVSARQELTDRLEQVSLILLEVYKDSDAVAEVNAAIATEYYVDERVLLKDLLEPGNSPVYKLSKFKEKYKKEPKFAKRFKEALSTGKYPESHKFKSSSGRTTATAQALEDYFTRNNTYIYYPYSDNYAGYTGLMTTSSTPSYDTDSHTGRREYYCGDRDNPDICIRTVTVNDDYAFTSPTHIVGVIAEPARTGQTTGTELHKVFLGWIRCTKQYDRLFSFTGNGGGSEIKVVRADGYLKQDGQQISAPEGVISIGSSGSISRKNIRKGNWIRVYAIWDWNWEVDNTEEVLGIYEKDTQGESKIEGSITTKVKLSNSIDTETKPISYSITVKTKDEIIRNFKINRAAFFSDGTNDQGHGFHDGWPIFDGGSPVSYTLPFQIVQ